MCVCEVQTHTKQLLEGDAGLWLLGCMCMFMGTTPSLVMDDMLPKSTEGGGGEGEEEWSNVCTCAAAIFSRSICLQGEAGN